MTMVNFPSGSIGPTGPDGHGSQTQDSIAVLAWLVNSGVTNSHDLQTNAFGSRDGIDQALSVAEYNDIGCYYERSIPGTDREASVTFDTTSAIQRKNLQGVIYKWVQDSGSTGHFEGITYSLNTSGSAVNKGSGKVGLPCTSQPYATGNSIQIRGSVNYNGTFTVDSTSSANEIVITASYVSETFTGSETVNQRVTLGAGNNNPDVEKGVIVSFLSGGYTIASITSTGDATGGVDLFTTKASENVSGIYRITVKNSLTTLGNYKTTINTWSTPWSDSPCARESHALAYDSTNKLFWVYGGYHSTQGYKSDLWKFNPATNQWAQVTPSGGSPNIRTQHSMIFDPTTGTTGCLWIFAGMNASGTRINELWKYDISANTWTQKGTTSPPTARSEHTAIFDSVNSTMLVYGGWNGSSNNNELWKYTPSSDTWAQITFSGTITGRREHCAIYEGGSTQLMWVWGGYTGSSTNELWKYDVVANSFTQITQTSPPTARQEHTLAYDPVNRYMYLFGGYQYLADFYRYNLATNTWTTMSPAANTWTPEGRQNSCMGWDSQNNQIFMFGGYSNAGSTTHAATYRSDFWYFSPSSNAWVPIAPSARSGHFQVYCSASNCMLVGMGWDEYTNEGIFFRDTWKFDLTTLTWSRPYTATYPTFRTKVQACYDSVNNCVWMYGGYYGNSELWKFDFATMNWIYITPSGAACDGKYAGCAVFDSDNQVVYVFSGANTSYFAWKYILSQNVWVRMNPISSTTFNNREGCAAVYDPISKSIYIYGGVTYRSELWRWDLTNNYLVMLSPTGTPPPNGRQYPGYFYNASNQSMYIFGGYDGTIRATDVYRYDIASNTWSQVSISSPLAEGPELTFGGGAYDPVNDDYYCAGGRFTANNVNRESVFKLNLTDSYAPTQIGVFLTSAYKTLGALSWTHLKNITPVQTTTGSSSIYHSLSFDGKQTFKVLSLGSEISINVSGVAVDKGGGKVGIPSTTHGLSTGNRVRLYGTTNYNGNFAVDADTTTNEIVIVATYVAETFTSTAKCRTTVWIAIVQYSGGNWQYLDGSSAWQNASSNDVYTALKQAFAIAANQMIGSALSSISQIEWELSGGFIPATTASLDFGVGLVASNPDVPFLTSYITTYSSTYNDLTLTTSSWEASSNDPTNANCNIDLEPIDSITLDTDLKAWVSIDDGSHYEQITGLSTFKQVGSHIYVKGTKSGITPRGDKTMRLKITSHNSKNIRVHAIALEACYN
jgi:hypothetical protein